MCIAFMNLKPYHATIAARWIGWWVSKATLPLLPSTPEDTATNICTHGHIHTLKAPSWLLLAQALPAPAQCLFLRLFQRRRHWFRISTLQYTEVPDTSEAVAALIAADFARTADAPTTVGVSASNFLI